MERIETDILICGGGIAGLVAAAAFGRAGFDVLCVDPKPVLPAPTSHGADMRSTAFLVPSRDVLAKAGLWDALEPHATPLQVMRLADAGGEAAEVRYIADFDASEISDSPFGWNLPNWLLRRDIAAALTALPNVTWHEGIAVKALTTRMTEARARLSDGRSVSARLVIGADGRASFIRDALGIDATVKRYGQSALAFIVETEEPHKNISTEVHRTGGPFTLVPLPDHEGRYYASVVWMEPTAEARRLQGLSEQEFSAAATTRSCAVQGALKLASSRGIWPITSLKAKSLTGQRCALVAEAAHAVPPIGAQGLNMSLADISCLLELAEQDRTGLGEEAMLATYEQARMPDIAAHVMGIDLLNRAAMAKNDNLRALRLKALQSLHQTTPVRRTLMRLGRGG